MANTAKVAYIPECLGIRPLSLYWQKWIRIERIIAGISGRIELNCTVKPFTDGEGKDDFDDIRNDIGEYTPGQGCPYTNLSAIFGINSNKPQSTK